VPEWQGHCVYLSEQSPLQCHQTGVRLGCECGVLWQRGLHVGGNKGQLLQEQGKFIDLVIMSSEAVFELSMLLFLFKAGW